jgi:Zn-dependent peptidase ImmA (M78 family)
MKRLAHTRIEQLEQIVRAKRRIHPELRRPMDWGGFRAVCDREGVVMQLADVKRPACLFNVDGTWVILIRREGVRQLMPGAHELGHLWAHVDQEPLGRFEATYYMDTEWAEDPREEEADYIAGLLIVGPPRTE